MAEMSRAIRLQLQKHGPTLKEIPTDALASYIQITGALYADLREEYERRDPDKDHDEVRP
jgi:hypothetical protein